MQLRYLLVYLLILTVLIQPLWQLGILISFQINQDYIAENLCENKDKPKLQCNGHCQLFKQLGETKGPQNSIFQKNIAQDFEVYCQSLFVCSISKKRKSIFIPENKYQILDINLEQDAFVIGVFRPPQISLS